MIENKELVGVLLDIKTEIAQVKSASEVTQALLKTHIETFNRHVEEYDKLVIRVEVVESTQDRQKGFLTAVNLAFGAVGAAIAVIGDWLFRRSG